MRLLYFIDHLFPGGAEQSLAVMVPYLVSSGCELEVACLLERPGLRDELEKAGARVVRVGGSSRPAWILNAVRLVRDRRPDLVHTTLFEADVVGRIAGSFSGVPVVSSLVNLAYGPEQKRDRRLVPWKVDAARFLDAATAQLVTRFHALTSNVADVMARRLYISRKPIDIIPRGRDPVRLGRRTENRRQVARRLIGADPEEIVLLATARQEYQKGLDVLLDSLPIVLERVPNARLYLCGRQGAASQDLERKAAAADSRVRMLGRRDDIPDLMCAADVLVLPSRWEGLGGVLLEAMALEAPIVASALPAIREVLDDGACGRLVPPERPEELAEAIVAALLVPEETERKVGLARDRYLECYTVDRVAKQMISFYERALTQRKGALLPQSHNIGAYGQVSGGESRFP